jgi:hypothetical protein
MRVTVARSARAWLARRVALLLALAGAIAVDELLAAAVISVMLTGGRALAADAAMLDESGCTRCKKTRRTCRSTTTRKQIGGGRP